MPEPELAQNNQYLPHFPPGVIKLLETQHLVIVGTIRIGAKNPYNAYITCKEKSTDYIVRGIVDRNRALDGDEVWALVKTNNESRAVVVGIKEKRASRIVLGSVYYKRKDILVLIPRDNRLPKLHIPSNKFSKVRPGSLLASEITAWDNPVYAEGGNIHIIGNPGTIEAETEGILIRCGLEVSPYDEAMTVGIPDEHYELTAEDKEGREDWTKRCIFTIDPLTARDLDDAVSWRPLADGGAEVGVHIADVTHFLNNDCPLDTAVGARATTVYLVDRVFHMLPPQMCKACSLTPGKEKLAFSVIFELSSDGKVKSRRFQKTVINSCIQLSYEQAQEILEKKNILLEDIKNGFTPDDITSAVLALGKLADHMQAARVENGALRIDQRKIFFKFDYFRNVPSQIVNEKRLPAHCLIEELMLLANTTVAEFLKEKLPNHALLRYHPPPKQDYFRKLKDLLSQLDVELDNSSSAELQASLLRLEQKEGMDAGKYQAINHLLAKAMMRAKYSCNEFMVSEDQQGHYALSIPLYTHFTSPIRRYADIVVHRLLEDALKGGSARNSSDDIQSAATNCNLKKFSAKAAEEASSELFYAIFVGEQGSLFVQATVCGMNENCFDAIIVNTNITIGLFYEDIDGVVEVVKGEKSNTVTALEIRWFDGHTQVLNMFSTVNLELTRGASVSIQARLLPI